MVYRKLHDFPGKSMWLHFGSLIRISRAPFRILSYNGEHYFRVTLRILCHRIQVAGILAHKLEPAKRDLSCSSVYSKHYRVLGKEVTHVPIHIVNYTFQNQRCQQDFLSINNSGLNIVSSFHSGQDIKTNHKRLDLRTFTKISTLNY